MTEKELQDFLRTSKQIIMKGPVKIGNGVLECGGIETDPNKHKEEMQMLQEIMEQVKSTAGSTDASASINMLVEKLLESNPTSTEMLEVLQKLVGTVSNTATIPHRQIASDQQSAMQLDELISTYSMVQIQEGSWTTKTTSENIAIFDLLKSYFGDRPIKDISHEDVDQFRSILLMLPPNMNVRFSKW